MIHEVFYFLSWVIRMTEKRISKKIDKLCKVDDYETLNWIGNLMGDAGLTAGKRGLIKKQSFGNPKPYKFENLTVFLPEDVDDYLTCLYGDWRTPPPIEKQIAHHNYYYDLGKSYLEH